MTPTLQHRNGTLFIDNSQLQAGAVAESHLTAEIASGSSTLTVKNIIGFGINQAILIEELGGENAEIILTHTATVPSGTTITLASNTVKTHPAGSRVRVIMYNQIELKRHTSNDSASATALTVATTANFNPISSLGSGLVAVDPTKVIQTHETSEFTSGYFFARYKNSITSDFSSYTDGCVYGGWAENTVGYMMDQALSDLELTLSEKIQLKDVFSWLNEAMREIKGKLKRWPEHFSDNSVLGQTTRGIRVVAMPSDIYDTETNKSLTGLRIGDGPNLTYLDPSEFDQQLIGEKTTQVRTQAVATDTTLAIDNSYDFEDSGTVNVYVSGTKYAITYTGVTRSATTGILTGIPASGDGSITVTIPVDTNVWQGEQEGVPEFFTVRNAQIEFTPLPDSTEDNQNIYADYNKVATSVNSQGDTIDNQRFDMLQPYLTWRMYCKQKLSGMLDKKSDWYTTYKERLNDAIRTLPASRTAQWAPRINTMSRRGPFTRTATDEE